MVAAINAPDYDHAAWCGACVQVLGPSATSIVVRIVDQCVGCAKGDLMLSIPAFTTFAQLSQGQFAIAWHEVACDVTGPIAYRQRDDTTVSLAAFQIRNSRYPIATLEARAADGTYAALARGDDNYSVAASGLGPGPFTLRTTDGRGQGLEDVNIALAAGSVMSGSAQFPTCQ
jgi:expansin